MNGQIILQMRKSFLASSDLSINKLTSQQFSISSSEIFNIVISLYILDIASHFSKQNWLLSLSTFQTKSESISYCKLCWKKQWLLWISNLKKSCFYFLPSKNAYWNFHFHFTFLTFNLVHIGFRYHFGELTSVKWLSNHPDAVLFFFSKSFSFFSSRLTLLYNQHTPPSYNCVLCLSNLFPLSLFKSDPIIKPPLSLVL